MTNEKWETRKEQIITCQYNLLFLIFKLFICKRFYLYYYVCKCFALFLWLWNSGSSPKAKDLSIFLINTMERLQIVYKGTIVSEKVGKMNAYKWYFFIQHAGDHYTLGQCL